MIEFIHATYFRRARLVLFALSCCHLFFGATIGPLRAQPPMRPSEAAEPARASEGAATSATLPALALGKIIDLTHAFDEQTIYWPTARRFKLVRGPAGVTAQGYYYAANEFAAAEHGGTHLDAPIHFAAGQKSAEAIPLERLIGYAAVIDVAAACEKDRDYTISIEDLRRWESDQGRPLVDVIVLLRTGYSRHWPDANAYLGTDKRGPDAVPDLHFPGLAPEAARWLVEHRSIKAIGIDTASIDPGQSQRFESHVALCTANVPIFENVAHLDQLPTAGATVIALPMKIAGGSGGPLRIIATLPATPEDENGK